MSVRNKNDSVSGQREKGAGETIPVGIRGSGQPQTFGFRSSQAVSHPDPHARSQGCHARRPLRKLPGPMSLPAETGRPIRSVGTEEARRLCHVQVPREPGRRHREAFGREGREDQGDARNDSQDAGQAEPLIEDLGSSLRFIPKHAHIESSSPVSENYRRYHQPIIQCVLHVAHCPSLRPIFQPNRAHSLEV